MKSWNCDCDGRDNCKENCGCEKPIDMQQFSQDFKDIARSSLESNTVCNSWFYRDDGNGRYRDCLRRDNCPFVADPVIICGMSVSEDEEE